MAPQRRGSAVSLFALCYFGGQTVGVALAGAGAAWLGTRGVILAGMAVVFLVARLFAHAREHKFG
jgi:MFS family permease